MTEHRRILNFIAAVRDSYPSAKDVYLNGGCYNFFVILRNVFPESKAYYNGNHIATMINNKLYDITGTISKKNYLPITDTYIKERLSRKLKQMKP